MTDPLNWTEKFARGLRRRSTRKLSVIALAIMGVELPPSVSVGEGLRLAHGAVGLVVHESTVIGDRVRIFSGVTIGRSDQYLTRDLTAPGGGVVVGDDVVIGTGAKVLFRGGQTISIGRGAVIGANAVVNRDVPEGEIWAGIPATRVGWNPTFVS